MQNPDSTVELLIPARSRDLGGFRVGRVLPFPQRRMVGPFIFLDHLGPLELPVPIPRTSDVRPHPHIGLSTVTYLFDGELTHRDSLGFEQVIRPGDVNWMTAGRGISHSERFDGMRERGGRVHGLQAWVALPNEHEEDGPSFEHYEGERLPMIDDNGVRARLIAGSAFGAASGVRVHSPLVYAHLELQEGARAELSLSYPELAAYVVDGSVEVGGEMVSAKTMIVFAAGSAPVLKARERTTVMVLGGEPVGPRHVWWNFVSSSKERIEQAKHDWKEGRFVLPPSDNAERIPLPDGE